MSNKKYVLLSYKISKSAPLYGDTPAIEIKPQKDISKGDACNTSIITFSNHSGTHIDAPLHFDISGRGICDYSIEELVFHSPLVLNCPKEINTMIEIKDLEKYSESIKSCDMLIINTGFCFKRNMIEYKLNNPGIAAETAAWLRRFRNLRAVGIDTISISSIKQREEGRSAHKNFLVGKKGGTPPIVIIEDMDLTGLSKSSEFEKIFVFPLFLEGSDAAPCTIVGQRINNVK